VNPAFRAGLLAACQPFLAYLFGFALAALGTAVLMVVLACNSPDEDNPTRRIRTFKSLIKAVFAAFFASQRRRRSRHWVEAICLGFVERLFVHLVLGLAARVVAFDPGHLVIGNAVEAASTTATPGKGYKTGYYKAHDYNSDHNRLFPAVFHAENLQTTE
jgi:hypothetical protein